MIPFKLNVPNAKVTNNIIYLNGSMTLADVENKIPKNNFIFDRGSISIKDLNKTLFKIKKIYFPYSDLEFNLLPIHDKIIKD